MFNIEKSIHICKHNFLLNVKYLLQFEYHNFVNLLSILFYSC